MFGFRFPENFRYPYVADSVQDFWRRWHISLSTWFRDYVYVPLGGNRVSPGRTLPQPGDRVLPVRPVAWRELDLRGRGVSSTARSWSSNACAPSARRRARPRPAWRPAWAATLYTLIVVMVGWVLFRADTLAQAGGMLRAMAGFGQGLPTTYAWPWYVTPELAVAFGCGLVGATPLLPTLARRWSTGGGAAGNLSPSLPWASSAVVTVALVVLLGASVMLSAARTYSPFIYFRF